MDTALQFSGGKDSLACLYLYRRQWSNMYIVWVNTGAELPETLEQMAAIKDMVPNFIEIKSDQPANIQKAGYPAETVPFSLSFLGKKLNGDVSHYWQESTACCMSNLWAPMQHMMEQLGIKKIIRGQKSCDSRKSTIKNGDVINGVEYIFPLESWTDDDVFAFLNENNVQLPRYYDFGASSIDCWDCTAYLYEPNRLKYLKKFHPQKHDIVNSRLGILKSAMKKELDLIEVAHV